MASLRALAECIGVTGTGSFSVVGDFFGYASPPPWSLAGSQANLPQSLSVLTQMKRVQDKHIHLDVVRVGTGANGLLPAADEQNLDCAVQLTRDIYAKIGVGIGRVIRWFRISQADHPELVVIDDDCEAVDMIGDFDAHGGGIDVFLVQVWIGDSVGITPAKPDGVAVESRASDFLGTARTFAHELGHFLGLGHENDLPNNLMCQSSHANPMPGSARLNADQAATVLDADEMRNAC